MSWVYPLSEAVQTTRLGIAAAFVWTGTAFLVAGAAEVVIIVGFGSGLSFPWLALAGIALSAATLIVAATLRRLRLFLTAGAIVATFGASWMVADGLIQAGLQPDGWVNFPLFAVACAAALTGAVADRRTGFIGSLVAFTGAQLAFVIAAGDAAPFPTLVDPAAVTVAGIVAAYHALHGVVRRRARSSGARFDAVDQAEAEAEERRALLLRSRALVHDTVLGELSAVGMTAPGPLSEAMRTSILSSLETVRSTVGQRLAVASSRAVAFADLLSRFRVAGLTVAVTGEATAVDRLTPTVRHALLQAIEQCLVNVMNHSGEDRAEVSVTLSDGRLVVTVVDEGVGFDDSDVPVDRMGLRESVRGRIHSLGGSVRVLSGAGQGTSIVMSVTSSAEPT